MFNTTTKLLPLLLAAAVPLAGCQTTASQIRASGSMGPTDAEFVDAAYSIAQLDERAGTLATTKAQDPRVKDLAAKMSSEAQVLYPNLRGALQAENKPVPNGIAPDVTARIQTLNGLSGPAFDRAFVDAELDAHKRAVDILRRESASTKDAALKTQVDAELPAVQSNLDTLTAISTTLTPAQG